MALSELSQRVFQNNQTTQNRPPAVNMFDFQPPAQVEDKNMTRDEVRKALANVPDKSAGIQKLISN